MGAAVALVAVVVLTSAALLRRRPAWALAIVFGGSFAAGALAADSGRSVVLDLLIGVIGLEVCFVAATRSRAASVPLAAAAICLLIGWQVAWGTAAIPDPHMELIAGILVLAVAWLIGHTIRLSHLHSEELRAQATAQAITAERLRIARDLHDMVAHSIGVIAIQAGAGRRVIGRHPDQAAEALAAIEVTSREALAGVRRMLGVLRRADLGQLPGAAAPGPAPGPAPSLAGLDGLDRLAETTLDAGVHVEVCRRGDTGPLPAEVDQAAFRIIQEAVTNVVRHAAASQCQVSIGQSAAELSIEVTDRGRGGPVTGDGYGVAGMRERAILLGGQFSAGPRPGGGFRVTARLPLAAGAP